VVVEIQVVVLVVIAETETPMLEVADRVLLFLLTQAFSMI
jgi:hypothetical protein